MSGIYHEKLLELTTTPDFIRNICILAHVDHGKTTIADSLLSTNGIINKRLAGQLRYLDDRSDEQTRGITMKTSSIALYYGSEDTKTEYLINLIDSPGHVDFSLEVISAARVSDGAFIVVDVIEGVCSQTISVLEEAFLEKVKMILVLNKIDRLIIEKKMTPMEIFDHLTKLIESVNATVAEIRTKNYNIDLVNDDDVEIREMQDEEFVPSSRNVIFASAIDGWAFRLFDFAKLYSEQFGLSVESIESDLFKDCYFDKRKNRIAQNARQNGKSPLFVTTVLSSICALYNHVIINRDTEKIQTIIQKLGLKVNNRDINSSVPKTQLRAILSEFLPLGKALMESTVGIVPSPREISQEKIARILRHDLRFRTEETQLKTMETLLQKCHPDETTVGYVCKVISVNRTQLVKNRFNNVACAIDINARKEAIRKKRTELQQQQQHEIDDAPAITTIEKPPDRIIIGLTRLFSGTLSKNTEIRVILPKNEVKTVLVSDLYLMLGRDLIPMQSATCGNIVAFGDLSEHIIRTATISSTVDCLPLLEVETNFEPLYRTAIEPESLLDMSELLSAIKKLTQIDNCVQCTLQDNGQYVILSAGDVHLEKCMEDLKSLTSVRFRVSEPIVSLRETAISEPNETSRTEMPDLDDIGLKLTIQAHCATENIVRTITNHFSVLKTVELAHNTDNDNVEPHVNLPDAVLSKIKHQIGGALSELGCGSDLSERIMSLGANRNDCCILINCADENQVHSIWNKANTADSRYFYDNCLISAFQLTVKSGPICDEPMKNVVFTVKEFVVHPQKSNVVNPGSVIKAIRSACVAAFSNLSPRLMEPVFATTMFVESTYLGKVHKALSRKYGKVVSSTQIASNVFKLNAVLPVLESRDFCNEIRIETSGIVNPVLQFDGYGLIPNSPFTPNVGDEEDENVSMENRAYKLMISTRRRKGLTFGEQVVCSAEKQRTMNKKK